MSILKILINNSKNLSKNPEAYVTDHIERTKHEGNRNDPNQGDSKRCHGFLSFLCWFYYTVYATVLSSLDARRTILTHHIIEQLIQLFHDRLIRLDIDGVKHILRLDFRICTRMDDANTVRFLTENLSNTSHHHIERHVGHFLFLYPIVLLCFHYTVFIDRCKRNLWIF